MRKDGRPRPKASYHGPERSTESNHEAGSFAASVNNRLGGPGDGDLAGRGPNGGGQQRARGDGRRHLPEGSPGLPDPSGIQGDKTRRAEAADTVRFQGRNFK